MKVRDVLTMCNTIIDTHGLSSKCAEVRVSRDIIAEMGKLTTKMGYHILNETIPTRAEHIKTPLDFALHRINTTLVNRIDIRFLTETPP